MKIIDSLFRFIANTMTDVGKTTKGILPIKYGGTGISDFRSAVQNNYSGIVVADVSVPSGIDYKLGSINIPKGINLIIIYGDFAINATGYRALWLASAGSTDVRYFINRDHRMATPNVPSTLRIVSTFSSSDGETLDLYCRQNSGSALTFKARYVVIKLGGYNKLISMPIRKRGWA